MIVSGAIQMVMVNFNMNEQFKYDIIKNIISNNEILFPEFKRATKKNLA